MSNSPTASARPADTAGQTIQLHLPPRKVAQHAQQAARQRAEPFMRLTRPRSPLLHAWQQGEQAQLFVVNGSGLFDLSPTLLAQLERALTDGQEADWLQQQGLNVPPLVDDAPPSELKVHALSLAVAQKCNLGCTYCYAQQGEFGGDAQNMPLATAQASVDLLLREAASSGKANLAFLGGEPLVNRSVLQQTTRYAAAQAAQLGIKLSFSITSNGTLITPADAEFFEQYGFAVTISLDGDQQTHDRLRPSKGGAGSFARIMRNVRPLLASQRQMQVSARVTVTPQNLKLQDTLDAFLSEGFHSVGFSPMLSSPTGRDEMDGDALAVMLGEMIACGQRYEQQVMAGRRYAFANMNNAMRELGRGTHRPYPCGAGAGYFGVSASGELAACHRFVNDEAAAMGDVLQGVDVLKRNHWLSARHVHRQSPCNGCWARYLCGGGCHHEVIARGRPACDYIRGWLHYCLGAYLRLQPYLAQHHAAEPTHG